jgi:methionyl-tRNA formyltransferase
MPEPKRVIFMGTPDFAATVLADLLDDGVNITAVVTQPDAPRGRGYGVDPTPVKEEASVRGIRVFQPQRVKASGLLEKLAAEQPDLIIVAAFGQILPAELLVIPTYGCINIHTSLLPKYRGAAPIARAIMAGEEVTGITIMQMDVGLDTGDILLQRSVKIEDSDTTQSLTGKLAKLAGQMCLEYLHLLKKEAIVPRKQDGALSTYAKMLGKSEALIDFTLSAVQISRNVRGMIPWPGAYTFYNGKRLLIKRATLTAETDDWSATYEPGYVARVDKRNIYVATGDGLLRIESLQPEGKKVMDCDVFLAGTHVKVGERLGVSGQKESQV